MEFGIHGISARRDRIEIITYADKTCSLVTVIVCGKGRDREDGGGIENVWRKRIRKTRYVVTKTIEDLKKKACKK